MRLSTVFVPVSAAWLALAPVAHAGARAGFDAPPSGGRRRRYPPQDIGSVFMRERRP